MTKNPKPLTRPRPGEPNHGKSCYQPGSLPVTDLPMQPSLKEQMGADLPSVESCTEAAKRNGVSLLDFCRVCAVRSSCGIIIPAPPQNTEVPAFDHKACILCDHVIVQKILGNKCGESGALCCNLKECPIEARKKREVVSAPVKQLTIEAYGDGAISITHYPFETHFNKQEVAELRAYINKDVIAEMERIESIELIEEQDIYRDGIREAIRLIKGGTP